MEDIEGETTATATWLVRVDKAGKYNNIFVDFTGLLSPFNIPVDLDFKYNGVIYKAEEAVLSLAIETTASTSSKFTLTNVSVDDGDENTIEDLYNVQITMDEYAEFNDCEFIVLKYPSGLIEKIEWVDETKQETKRTIYLPVNFDANTDVTTLRTLKPGESISGIMHYTYHEE